MRLAKCMVVLFVAMLAIVVATSSLKEHWVLPKECVRIFYDGESQEQWASGARFAQSLQILLKPYSEYKVQKSLITDYRAGDIAICQKNIYVGTHIDHRVPRVFVEDFMSTRGSVAWFGYNVWQMGPRLERELGLRFVRMAQSERKAAFDQILYEGGLFGKRVGGDSSVVDRQVELLPADVSKFVTLAESRSSRTREIIPYIVQVRNRLYVADIPDFSRASRHLTQMFSEVIAGFMAPMPHHLHPKIIAATEKEKGAW